MLQQTMQREIGLHLTFECPHTPPAVQRAYMRHRQDSFSCLSSGQKICLFLLTCHFETRWDWLTASGRFTEVSYTYVKHGWGLQHVLYFCDVLRWFSLKKLGLRCSSCVPSSGPCLWTAVPFCLCQTFPPCSRPRSAPLQLTYASWRRSSVASKPWLLTQLSLLVWRPLCYSSQVRSYLSGNVWCSCFERTI